MDDSNKPDIDQLDEAICRVIDCAIQSISFRHLLGSLEQSWRIVWAILRCPGRTVAAYVDLIHWRSAPAIADLLRELCDQGWLAQISGRFWPTQAGEALSAALTLEITQSAHCFARLPRGALRRMVGWCEQLYAAIPIEHLTSHQHYAYGLRPVLPARGPLAQRLLVACLALQHYQQDAWALACQQQIPAQPAAELTGLSEQRVDYRVAWQSIYAQQMHTVAAALDQATRRSFIDCSLKIQRSCARQPLLIDRWRVASIRLIMRQRGPGSRADYPQP